MPRGQNIRRPRFNLGLRAVPQAEERVELIIVRESSNAYPDLPCSLSSRRSINPTSSCTCELIARISGPRQSLAIYRPGVSDLREGPSLPPIKAAAVK
jgi:hypothetical protein